MRSAPCLLRGARPGAPRSGAEASRLHRSAASPSASAPMPWTCSGAAWCALWRPSPCWPPAAWARWARLLPLPAGTRLGCAQECPASVQLHAHMSLGPLASTRVGTLPGCSLLAPCLTLPIGRVQVYPATTNPAVSTGDGQAMAARANARLAGMEFVQFHPTGFAGPSALAGQQTFLISEAVRGEGGHLLTLDGHRCAAVSCCSSCSPTIGSTCSSAAGSAV